MHHRNQGLTGPLFTFFLMIGCYSYVMSNWAS